MPFLRPTSHLSAPKETATPVHQYPCTHHSIWLQATCSSADTQVRPSAYNQPCHVGCPCDQASNQLRKYRRRMRVPKRSPTQAMPRDHCTGEKAGSRAWELAIYSMVGMKRGGAREHVRCRQDESQMHGPHVQGMLCKVMFPTGAPQLLSYPHLQQGSPPVQAQQGIPESCAMSPLLLLRGIVCFREAIQALRTAWAWVLVRCRKPRRPPALQQMLRRTAFPSSLAPAPGLGCTSRPPPRGHRCPSPFE